MRNMTTVPQYLHDNRPGYMFCDSLGMLLRTVFIVITMQNQCRATDEWQLTV